MATYQMKIVSSYSQYNGLLSRKCTCALRSSVKVDKTRRLVLPLKTATRTRASRITLASGRYEASRNYNSAANHTLARLSLSCGRASRVPTVAGQQGRPTHLRKSLGGRPQVLSPRTASSCSPRCMTRTPCPHTSPAQLRPKAYPQNPPNPLP